MAKRILREAFNIKNASRTAKDGHEYKIAYIDPATSENTFAFKDAIKKYNAKYFSDLKAWGWFLGQNPESVYRQYIQPCMEYLTTVEDGGKGERSNKVTEIIDQLIQDLQGKIQSIKVPNVKNLVDELVQFKADLLNCVSSEEFKKRLEPIIKFQQAQGHAFSFKNALLIMFQDPKATMVKSETAWGKMNRIVVDKSLPIILWRPDKEPLTISQKNNIRRQFLANAGVNSVNELNPGQKEELRVQLSGGKIKTNMDGRPMYKTYYGYDIRFTKQMEGKEELVNGNKGEIDWYDKSTEQSEYIAMLVKSCTKMIQESGVQIEYVPLESMGGALGVSTSGKIKLSDKEEYSQNYFDTIVHEFSHELLHQKYLKKSGNEEWARFFVGTQNGRGYVEQQAELSAWIVCKHFNLDRIQSLNYTANWGMNDRTCAKVFDSVAECASFIIKKIGSYISAANAEVNNNGEDIETEE